MLPIISVPYITFLTGEKFNIIFTNAGFPEIYNLQVIQRN